MRVWLVRKRAEVLHDLLEEDEEDVPTWYLLACAHQQEAAGADEAGKEDGVSPYKYLNAGAFVGRGSAWRKMFSPLWCITKFTFLHDAKFGALVLGMVRDP